MNIEKLHLLKSKAEEALQNASNLLEHEPVKQLIHELQVYQEELEAQKFELEENQIQIEELAAKFSNIFDLAPVGYLLLNEQDEIIDANREAHKLLQIPAHVHVSKRVTSYIKTPDSIKSFLQWIVGRDDNFLDLQIRSNPDMWINLRKTRLEDQEATTLVSLMDISEQVQSHTKLVNEANYDALTHLPNRSLLSDRLTQAMSRAKRLKTVMSVIFIDLDGFKEINDQHGHNVGDQLLVSIYKRLKDSLRLSDTISRIGGDEFVAVVTDLNSYGEEVRLYQRLLNAISAPLQISGKTLQVSGSIGITVYPQQNDINGDQLIRQADHAMYQAKLLGKNTYCVFDMKPDASHIENAKYLKEIQVALENDQLRLFYQPIINLKDGNLYGFEALIRWQHPQRGLISPDSFIHKIDKNPLGLAVDEWVLNTALDQLDSWNKHWKKVQMSINVSAIYLKSEQFTDTLKTLLRLHPSIEPSQLELEVLETNALDDLEQASKVIEVCNKLGVGVSLDDFGTGYSSLAYIRQLPIRKLKIDRSFITDMFDDTGNLSIITGILGLAGAFQLKTVAEGIETQRHLDILAELGCNFGQGYFIGKPLQAHEVNEWYTAYRLYSTWKTFKQLNHDEQSILIGMIQHEGWIKQLKDFLEGKRNDPPSKTANHCSLGMWLKDDLNKSSEIRQLIAPLIELYHELHTLSNEIIGLHYRNERDQVHAYMKQLHFCSAQLKKELDTVRVAVAPR